MDELIYLSAFIVESTLSSISCTCACFYLVAELAALTDSVVAAWFIQEIL